MKDEFVDNFAFPWPERDIKKELISFMHTCGFDWICDVDYTVEGHGFTRLFQGSVRAISHSVTIQPG